MLSDDVIDRLIQPIVDRQESINIYVIQTIAKRIKQIGKLLPSDAYKLQQLLKQGGDVRKINEALAQLTNSQVKDIKKLIRVVAENGYADLKPYYDYRQMPYIPFEENKELQRVVNAIANKTADTYVNMSKAQAFMIRDLKNPTVLKPTSISKTYYSAIDEAVQNVQAGTTDFNSAMKRTVNQLVDSGIRRVEYNTESGRRYTQRLDTAVRRNLIDGVRQINQGVQDEVGKEFGSDGKELSVHADSAPDHEPIQGRQFTNEEYDKLNNEQAFDSYPCEGQQAKHFAAIKRAIGTLNCRHFAFAIILDVMDPNYTDKQLDEMEAENKKGYTLPDGTHLTRYEVTQHMRKLETELRYAKESQIAFKAAGNMKMATKSQIKVNNLISEYDALCKDAKMRPKWERTNVSGYVPLKKDEYLY